MNVLYSIRQQVRTTVPEIDKRNRTWQGVCVFVRSFAPRYGYAGCAGVGAVDDPSSLTELYLTLSVSACFVFVFALAATLLCVPCLCCSDCAADPATAAATAAVDSPSTHLISGSIDASERVGLGRAHP